MSYNLNSEAVLPTVICTGMCSFIALSQWCPHCVHNSVGHTRSLIRIDNQDKREFYIAETEKNNWSTRQLERQTEIIKDPMILEFLGLKRESAYYEKDLESAIISQLQDFLLELGNGFSFVARQKRLHIDGDDYFVDLVFYNRLLQCFVIIEIKAQKLTHQDLGQLQMYVNYYDRLEKIENENSTIGILLSADKNDTMVKITLPEDNKTIVASKYQLYLPSEQQLLDELKKEIDRIDNKNSK